ncbi:hypothetical protein [Xylanibacter ruminicola]|uniref:Uncharacterized protein n=1 Tax=Xylanibacter ruminicola TaxID=839 RepID=A0A1M6U4K0_XYLRU|nr:hypothetical protein [Xylanibacter ruminicola]SHK64090.1 hypothetical protein SAMN05216463_10813 [Xylanibacter ruminicola]
MKIEIGESLIYSWLRHVKECQIVQTNWKVSSKWSEQSTNANWQKIYEELADLYIDELDVFGKNTNIGQLIKQTECDAIGISMGEEQKVYAVEVAYHEGGLGYGSPKKNASKIIAKFFRIAVCLNIYFGCTDAEIIFASPIIKKNSLDIIEPCIEKLQNFMKDHNFDFSFHILANDDFKTQLLDYVLLDSSNIKDSNELFVRSYQLWKMFYKQNSTSCQLSTSVYTEMKIGRLANHTLRDAIENNRVNMTEIKNMQRSDWSKEVFGINYPLLVSEESQFPKERYYVMPIEFDKKNYYLCSQWFEASSRNLLLKWINEHE